MLAKQFSKFLKLGFNSTWTENFQMFKLDLEKAEEPETKLPTSNGSWKKQESSRKMSISVLLTMSKPLTVSESSVTQLCPTVCDPMDCNTPGLPVHHQLAEFTQTHVYWVGDAIQPSHPLSSPSPPAVSLSQHQGLFKWVRSLHQVAKVLEYQLQHQSFQWTPRTDLF